MAQAVLEIPGFFCVWAWTSLFLDGKGSWVVAEPRQSAAATNCFTPKGGTAVALADPGPAPSDRDFLFQIFVFKPPERRFCQSFLSVGDSLGMELLANTVPAVPLHIS